ncbi:bifunctional oligoribonuclease/PAP phosphatase NrnA [bacterium]|nr:bifunctional oligoribonuclease/PAP phosphatase NrnA [bacterium]
MKSIIPEFEKALKKIRKCNNIVLVSHRHPDADTIGANIAMKIVLEKVFNKKIISVCADPLPSTLLFIKGNYKIESVLPKNYDCIIALDCSNKEQTKFPDEINKKNFIINIDHHATNTKYGDINIVKTDASSATEILYNFFKHYNINYKSHVATCLLAGIYNDTGSFMHSNTQEQTYKIAGELQSKGANTKIIAKNLFKTHSIEQLRLWGKVLLNARLNEKGTLVSKISTEELNKTNASPRELAGVINYLNCVPESKMTILLSEDLNGNIQGSMRSGNEDVDVSSLCEQFGGGGHKKAAGFTIPGKIVSQEFWKIEKPN